MFKPEALNLSELPSLPLEEKANLPIAAGIYFAIDSHGTIQYIGHSVNIRQRWYQHHRDSQLQKIGSIRIAWLGLEESLLSVTEAALIEYFKPVLNASNTLNIVESGIFARRIGELGIDLAELNRRFCSIRQKNGDKKAVPVNRRQMLTKAISNNGNPTIETFLSIVEALGGQVLVEWND